MAGASPLTVGSKSFDPNTFLDWWRDQGSSLISQNDFVAAVSDAFAIDPNDKYVYHAVASVTLPQVQRAIVQGAKGGLHAWYKDDSGQTLEPPPQNDIAAYTSIFLSSTSTAKALTAFKANAKKQSIRANVAGHLIANRLFPSDITIPKLSKAPHVNPYLDFWMWSCRELEWAGPEPLTVNITQSHHVLPVFYHHFGCVCPSFEALETIKKVSHGREVLDIGSGNGYWTIMLRRQGLRVSAVDNGASLWRTMWIGDTIQADAVQFITNTRSGAKEDVLLMVYPQVSSNFTESVIQSYKGRTLCIAGTQNHNGYTAFRQETIVEYVQQRMPHWRLVVQTPLPSFAGKDEALFVFEVRD